MDVIQQIRDKLHELDRPIAWLAKRIGVSRGCVDRILARQDRASGKTAAKIAAVLIQDATQQAVMVAALVTLETHKNKERERA